MNNNINDKSPGLQSIVDSPNLSNNFNNQKDSEDSDSKIDYVSQEEDPYQNKDLRRMTIEYIKILGIIEAEEEGETINIKEILESNQIPENFVLEKYEPENVIKNGNSTVIY